MPKKNNTPNATTTRTAKLFLTNIYKLDEKNEEALEAFYATYPKDPETFQELLLTMGRRLSSKASLYEMWSRCMMFLALAYDCEPHQVMGCLISEIRSGVFQTATSEYSQTPDIDRQVVKIRKARPKQAVKAATLHALRARHD